MPKQRANFRLSDEAIQTLQKYTSDHSLQNTTEALEKILSDLLSPRKSEGVFASGASDLLPCKQRVTIADELTCMNPPTLYKKVKISEISPEICRACQVLSHNLPEKYEVKETPREETFDRARQPVTDPNRTDMKTAGMVWCPEGMWVFPAKCDACRARNSGYWLNCQREKLRQKGAAAQDAKNLRVKGEKPGSNVLEQNAMTSDTPSPSMQENQTKQCQSTASKP